MLRWQERSGTAFPRCHLDRLESQLFEPRARPYDRLRALRARRDHTDFELQKIADEAEVVDGGFGEFAGILLAVGNTKR